MNEYCEIILLKNEIYAAYLFLNVIKIWKNETQERAYYISHLLYTQSKPYYIILKFLSFT